MWGSGAQRQPSGSSNASVADVSSTQRDTWASSRPSSGSWELPQTTDLTESPQKKDYSQLVSVKIKTYNEQNHIECLSVKDPQSPMNPGPRNRNSSGLSARIVSCQLKFNFKIFFFLLIMPDETGRPVTWCQVCFSLRKRPLTDCSWV